MSIWLRVGGYPATEIAAHTPPEWETWADGGCGPASWAFALSARSQHQALRVGSLVEVMCGPMPLWSGLMTDPDRTTWECTAYGLAAAGRNYLALDAGATTRDIGVAIGQAISRGWPVSNPTSISGVVSGDATGNPISVAELLDQYAAQLGRRWGVDARRRLYLTEDPTTPTWLASPGAAAFGSTSEDRAGLLFGRYLDAASGIYETASAGSGREADVDLTDRGAMSNAEAVTVLEGLLRRDYSGPAWTNGVTLTRDQLQTMGGTPAFLPAVTAVGSSMRSFGISNAVSAVSLHTVLGKTRYTAGDPTIYLEPANASPVAGGLSGVISAS